MARRAIKRPEKPSERSGTWILTAVFLSILGLAGAYFGLQFVSRSFDGEWKPTFLLISLLGLLALLLFLVAAFYTARKRLLQERVGGTMMAWLKSHVYLGVATLALAIAHWLLTPIAVRVSSGTIALVLLAVLVLSGTLWRFVYLRVPPRVPADTGNLSIRDSRERAAVFLAELEKLKVGKSSGFQRAVDDVLHGAGAGAPGAPSGRLNASEQEAWARSLELTSAIRQEAVRETRQRRYARVLQIWRILHLPLAIAALVAIGFHLFDTFEVGRALTGGEDEQFASAEDCASCHADVVDEWKLSPHRFAQTSTITRAQTHIALQTNPEFRKDCVNCHAPIGTKFSDSTTFPVGDDPGLDPDEATTEGITCVVCHTMEQHPEELAGFGDDLPIGERGAIGLGTMFGPPREGRAVPNSAHDSETGFMTDSIGASQMCGACHNVIADVDGNGIAPAGSDSAPNDSDSDGVLDENEIDSSTDLVLQSTFNEWEDFLFSQGGLGPGCVDCHMPATSGEIGRGSPLIGVQEERRSSHIFVGVDYELNTEYYSQEGMPPDALNSALEARENLLRSAVRLSVDIPEPRDGILAATVRIKNRSAHSFPTGFAFARQFWLDVSATSSSGGEVCLNRVEGFGPSCTSGSISDADDDLRYCIEEPGIRRDEEVRLLSALPAAECDPWLVSFQKILTDADRDADGVFEEVPYQTKRGGAVKDRVRAVAEPDGDTTALASIPAKGSASFRYEFDVSNIGSDSVSVRVVLRHRHLAPYIVQALEPYFSEDDPSAAELLANMTVVDMASNKPLGDDLTSPAIAARSAGAEITGGRELATSGAWIYLPIGIFLIGSTAGIARARRYRR